MGAVAEQVQIQCPTGWGYFRRSCGKWQGAPVGCRDLLCPDCQRRWAAEAVARWWPVVERMKQPRFLTLTVKSSWNLREREAFERASFRRLLDTRLGPRNWRKFWCESVQFARSHFQKNETDPERRVKRYQSQVKSLVRFRSTLQRWHKKHGRWPRVRDLFDFGISSPEVTIKYPAGWHMHRHIIYQGKFVPWSLWCVLWRQATGDGSYVVDIRAKPATYKTVQELIKYSLKPPKEMALTPAQANEFRSVFSNAKKVWRIGDATPADPEPLVCKLCGSTDCKVEPWTYERPWKWEMSADQKQVTLHLASGVVTLRKIDGVWQEWWALGDLKFRHDKLKCHSRPRDGPEAPPGAPVMDLLGELHRVAI